MSNRSIGVAVLLGTGALLLTPGAIWSYNNDGPGGGPHRRINQIALDRFLQAAAADPILKYYDFAPTLVKLGIARPSDAGPVHPFAAEYDTVTQKGDWYPEEVVPKSALAANPTTAGFLHIPTTVLVESTQTRPFCWWVIEGGFTADEPELHMSLRHFYDPQMRGVSSISGAKTCSYLTDVTDTADKVLSWLVGSTLNPCVDAKQLALKDSKHSWSEGQTRLRDAFDRPEADAQVRNKSFGKAWRCLGETMHLVADMTVPAHVRNDGHPGKLGFAGDPYEDFVSAQVVQDLAGGPVDSKLAGAIAACTSIAALFDCVATYTNTHYFSNDTISGIDYPTTLYRVDLLLRRDLHHPEVPRPAGINTPVHSNNKQPDYDAPKLDAYGFRFDDEEKDDSGTYVDRARGDRPIARRLADGRHVLDETCVYWQAKDLMPIAVAANVQALDLFLPRFGVKVDEFDRKAKVLRCHVVGYSRDPKSGKFSEAATTQFPGDSVRAVVLVTLGKEPHNFLLPLDKITDNRFEVKVQPVVDGILAEYLKEGGTPLPAEGIGLAVGLDLGGILIKSEPKTLGALRIEPKQVQLKTQGTQRFTVHVAGAQNQAVEWKVKENGGGTIDAGGAYVAPLIGGTFHVVATSKADKDATDVATVRVDEPEKKEVPPPPPITTSEISWQQAAFAAAGCRQAGNRSASLDKIYQVGDTRHGFVFLGDNPERVPGKPWVSGWYKEFDHGVLGTGPLARPYWLYYAAEVQVDSILEFIGRSESGGAVGLRPRVVERDAQKPELAAGCPGRRGRGVPAPSSGLALSVPARAVRLQPHSVCQSRRCPNG